MNTKQERLTIGAEPIKKKYERKKSGTAHFLAGGISGLITSAAGQPFDVLRTKMIGVQSHNDSAIRIVQNVLKNEGISGLYRGTVPTMLRVFPGAAIYYGTIHVLKGFATQKREGQAPGPLLNFAIGSFSRSIAATVTNPLFIVKSRFEYESVNGSHLRKASVMGTLQQIYKENGMRGMMRGLAPTLARDVPYAGLFYLIYKEIQPYFQLDETIDESSTRYHMTVVFPAAAMASCTATFITHPADVIRTRWHLRSSFDTKRGVKPYFRGVTPRLIKRTLASATSWVIYEQLASYFEQY